MLVVGFKPIFFLRNHAAYRKKVRLQKSNEFYPEGQIYQKDLNLFIYPITLFFWNVLNKQVNIRFLSGKKNSVFLNLDT